MIARTLAPLLLAFGCSPGLPGTAPCEPRSWGPDADGDGFAAALTVEACTAPVGWSDRAGDCDDAHPGRYPDALEVCDPDATDENCNGHADDLDPGLAEGRRPWYPDADGDGYGAFDPDVPRSPYTCAPPPGYGADGDCDDADPNEHPGGYDVCPFDTIDEDCDGSPTWYLDEDGDGHGVSPVESCDQPRAPLSGDCDDADPSRHPSAAEVCGDGIDQDCDANAGPCGVEGEWNLSLEPSQLRGSWVEAGDLDGNGAVDLLTCTRGEGVYVFGGPFDGTARDLSDAVLVVGGPPDPALTGAWLADLDGDARDDLLVAEGNSSSPRTWVVSGPRSGEVDDTDAALIITGTAPSGPPLDSDGDGVLELVTNAVQDHVQIGRLVGNVASGTWSADDLWLADLDGTAPTALGDVDADGLDDLAWVSGQHVAVVHGPVRGVYTAADADVLLQGPEPGAEATPSAPGDLDQDGTADLVITLTGEVTWTRDHCGEISLGTVLVLHAPPPTDMLDADASVTARPLEAVPGGAGDLDGDGLGDLLLGAPSNCDTYGSETMVLQGPFAGVIDVRAAAATMGLVRGSYPDSAVVSAAADLDGDGIDDLAMSGRQSTWLFFGGPGL